MVYHEPEKKGLMGLLKNKGFYAIAGLCAVAVGTGIFAARQTANTPPPAPPLTTAQRATIPWQPYEPPAEGEDSAVNKPATGIPDERTEASGPAPTAKPTQSPNTPYTGDYSLPFGTDIIRDYSDGELVYAPTLDDWRSHDGVDFGGAPGNEILAIQDGKVKAVIKDELWGNVVEIDHGNGLTARYCGFEKAGMPKAGDSVKRGKMMGKLGEIPCEAMDAPHLHLELRVNGKLVDPLAAMNKLGEGQ